MTIRDVIQDDRYLHVNPYRTAGDFLIGRYYRKTQNGGNRTPGEPDWYPHGYSMSLTDQHTGWIREVKSTTPSCTKSYPGGAVDESVTVSSSLVRPWDARDDLALYGKIADKYDDGKFNAPVFAGELGEATDMLAGRLRQLARVGAAVKRGNLKKAAKLLGVSPPRGRPKDAPKIKDKNNAYLQRDQTITSAWLELSYGWKPLLGDVSNLAEAIAKRDQPRQRRIYADHTIDRKVTASPSCAKATGSGKYSKSIVAYIEEVLPTLGDRMGLHDPASIAWELTPFSFVADWVIPIGDYLKARSIATRAKGVFVLSTFDRYHGSVREIACAPRYCGTSRTLQLIAWNKSATLTRTVTTSLPKLPMPTFHNPFGGNGPMDRLMSAVSLVREIFGSKTSRLV